MMQPPFTSDTVLQNRYRIIQTLGQGGFGRTYLAEDQRRFNELCAIKELIPTATGTFEWEKAQELFQREAAILYRIQHSQVPEFREKFEQNQRLFLVQDYVAGKTYRTLLDERKVIGGAFTENETLYLMRSLLPVLEHIHSKGIIHRDISPENIILRDSDRLPVLIDFGVVKELATKLQSPKSTEQTTYVGKIGYAPLEQLQSGRAYPSSDLYALAVTAIVLMTGKEPNELFDDNQHTWNWQLWVTVKPGFAEVLNRMLSPKPSTRYQTAADLTQALQYINQPHISTPNLSNLQTVPISHRPNPEQPDAHPQRATVSNAQQSSNSVLDNPLAIVAIAFIVVVLAGVGSWTVVMSIRNQERTSQTPETPPQTFPSPVVTGGSTPTPTVTPTINKPVVYRKRLRLGESNTVTVEDTITANQITEYTFFGEQGQQLTLLLDTEGSVFLTVLKPNREPLENSANQVTYYQGTLPVSDTYIIQLTPVPDVAEAEYSLNVQIENPNQPTSTPTPTEIIPTPLPTETTPTLTPTETPSPIETITPAPTPLETPSPTETTTPIPSDTSPLGEESNNPPVEETPEPNSGRVNYRL
jgi:serine/threonine protein kinase